MNYGDPTNPTGRAQVPGSSGGYGYDDGNDWGGHHGDSAATGRAGVGGVSIGGVPTGPRDGSAARPAAGRASVGRASVSPSGEDGRASGRAGLAGPAVGAASVGRASVRAGTPGADQDWAGGGSAAGSAYGWAGGAPGGGDGPDGRSGRTPLSAAARAKKVLRRNWIIAGLAAVIMVAGIGVVGTTYYFDDVALPNQLSMPESTTIYYADGKTAMAKIGDQNRTLIPYDQMPLHVQHAVVAAEDNSFYSNSGVDIKGIMRAAWNNFTGGERQGASTITQQYARNMADLQGISYSRKLREAVIAMKLSERYSKNDIMWFYLNTVYFGRGAYGLEAASQSYFGKSAKELTVAEGMVLAGMIKDPEGADSSGSPYDPTRHPDSAKDRWGYIRDNMVKLKLTLNPQTAAALQYPSNVKPFDPKDPNLGAQWGLDRPTGIIVHHVLDELSNAKNPQGKPIFPDLKTGGYKIITTINPAMQRAAETYADVGNKASPMYGQPANLQAALVAVEPYSGRVRAYYGGTNGAGSDYAGWYADPVLDDGKPTGYGAHPPGSSFKIYTLAAGLMAGYSVNSYWDGTSPKEFPRSGRTKANPVRNSSNANCQGGVQHCMLWEATEQSLNTPFFALAETVSAAKVLEVARAAGIRSMWATVGDGQSQRVDLTTVKSIGEVSPKYFSTEVGIGQYPVTVLDHANGVATIAARGKASHAHFVQQVYKGAGVVYAESVSSTQIPGFTPQMADDEAWALQKVVKQNSLEGGRPAAAKTGTWQFGLSEKLNAHAWMIGFTAPDMAKNNPGLATAVWMGNKDKEQAIKKKDGSDIFGSTGPGPIWKAFMNAALKGSATARFPEPKFVGDRIEGNATSPEPAPGGPDGKCLIPILCPSQGPGGGGGGPTHRR